LGDPVISIAIFSIGRLTLPTASNVTIKETFDLLEGPLNAVAKAIAHGGYAWLTRPRSECSDEELSTKVRASFLASDRTYGVRRAWRDMLADRPARHRRPVMASWRRGKRRPSSI